MAGFIHQQLSKWGLFLLFTLSLINLQGQGFTDITQLDGMSIIHDGEDPSIQGGDIGSGAAWIDYNADGLMDLYITMRVGANLLFKNLGPDGSGVIQWDEVAAAAGVQDASNDGAGVVVGDYNNDGYDDLYLANISEDVLFRNNGNGTFTDITAGSGLTGTGASRGNSASWGDYDNDGYLDLYISHHTPYPGASPAYRQDYLFHNDNGNGTFQNVSAILGLNDLEGLGFIGGWVDYDNDNDMDLILVNDCELGTGVPEDGTHTRIFRNDGPSLHWAIWDFTEVSASIGVNDCRNGMGIAVGDIDRDGWLDFAYTNIGACVLFQNDGAGTFSDISTSAGINGQNVNHYSWGTAFFDYDLDGWQDLLFVLGSLWDTGANEPKPNELYKNNGDADNDGAWDGDFTDMAPSLNMNDSGKSRSGIIADYDNDGDVDVFLLNYGELCVLKENTNSNGNNWLQVKLIGDFNQGSNINAIGARLKLTDGNGVVQHYEIRSGSNLGGGDDMRAFFGLGNASSITELEITWPSGTVQIENSLNINQLHYIGELAPLPVELSAFTAKQLEEAVLLEWFTNTEFENDYFTIQRSVDGRHFENIGEVEGRGESSQENFYEFVDKQPLEGDNYYRLRQTDFDGSTGFSEIILVRFESLKPQVSIQPNPVTRGEIKLSYQGRDDELNIEIFDMVGKRLFQSNLDGIDGQAEEMINTADFNNGLYVIRVSGKSYGETLKFVVSQ